jgi:hypothetical protein
VRASSFQSNHQSRALLLPGRRRSLPVCLPVCAFRPFPCPYLTRALDHNSSATITTITTTTTTTTTTTNYYCYYYYY